MPEPTPAETSGTRGWSALTLIVAFISGGLAGQVFTWLITRPKPAAITYRVTTTTLAAPEATGLIPDLRVAIGSQPIQALYAHNIEFSVRDGPDIQRAEVALTFSSGARLYGTKTEKPSELHNVDCNNISNGVRCTMYPLLARKPEAYRVILGSNQKEPPRIGFAAQGIELLPADSLASDKDRSLDRSFLLQMYAVMGSFMTALGVLMIAMALLRRSGR